MQFRQHNRTSLQQIQHGHLSCVLALKEGGELDTHPNVRDKKVFMFSQVRWNIASPKPGTSGPNFLTVKVGRQLPSWERSVQQPCADSGSSGWVCMAGSECSSVSTVTELMKMKKKVVSSAHLVSLRHEYLWVDCSYYGLNPGSIPSLHPQKFLFHKISFACIRAVQNTAFHNFFPSRAARDHGLAVKGFMEEGFCQERHDWWGKSCLMCNPQRIWVITDPAGELYRSNALGTEGCWINHSWLGQDGSCHEHLGAGRRMFLV